jgi:predicted nucleic acid-binding protein
MKSPSPLIDILDPLVLDASVLVNLHACGCGHEVLAALPNDVVVPEPVASELEHERSRRGGEHMFLNTALSRNILSIVSLTDREYETFSLLVASKVSLDDGEAAAIAIAASRGHMPVIDERKGRARAASMLRGRMPAWSLEVLQHPAVVSSIGEERSSQALYLALRNGRMRISPETADDVIALIGEVRARECTCLPNYRSRFFPA